MGSAAATSESGRGEPSPSGGGVETIGIRNGVRSIMSQPQKRRTRRHRFQLETLELRTLLSVSPATENGSQSAGATVQQPAAAVGTADTSGGNSSGAQGSSGGQGTNGA